MEVLVSVSLVDLKKKIIKTMTKEKQLDLIEYMNPKSLTKDVYTEYIKIQERRNFIRENNKELTNK